MNDKVLDVRRARTDPGTDVIMWEQKDELEDNQLWYENEKGVICSKLNGFALDGSGGYTP